MRIHSAGHSLPAPGPSVETTEKAVQSSSAQNPASCSSQTERPEAGSTQVRPNYPYSSVKTRLPPVSSTGQAISDTPSSLPGYLLLRRLDRRPLDEDSIKALVPADEALREARRALPFGRGNIDVDAQRTHLQSGARAVAAKRLRKDAERAGHEPMPENDEMNWHVLVAMSGQVFGAGNCGEHARIASFAYRALAQESGRSPREKIHLAEQPGKDHVWAETDNSSAGSSPIVMDPWSNGAAILAEDSRFAKDRSAVERTYSFTLAMAAEAGKVARETAENVLTHTTSRLQKRLADQLPNVSPLEGGRYQPEKSVLDEAFARRVSDKLNSDDPRRALQMEIEAVGVAMSLGAEGVKTVARQAPKVVRQARSVASSKGMPPRR
ncbi:AvrPphE [Pseudomonas savastanoi pv. phaseolicola]|nr:AvrPphE [Pseudomonas savastanoi pv. phaseolicola]